MDEYLEKLVRATANWTSRFCQQTPEATEEEACDYIREAFADYRGYAQRERIRRATFRACRLVYRLYLTSDIVDEEGWMESAVRDLSSGPPFAPLPEIQDRDEEEAEEE